jgi:hypothetical protein
MGPLVDLAATIRRRVRGNPDQTGTASARSERIQTRIDDGRIRHGGVEWEYTYGKTPPPSRLTARVEGPYCQGCGCCLWGEMDRRRFRRDRPVWACYECEERIPRQYDDVATERAAVQRAVLESKQADNSQLKSVLHHH